MDIFTQEAVEKTARQALLQAKYNPRKLALIHTSVALGASLLLTVINFILTRQIDHTGGLSGIGLRSVLSTAQSVLTMLSVLLLPFWETGFTAAAIGFSRQDDVYPNTLLSGFKRFGPVLRLLLLRAVLCAIVLFISMQISVGVFIISPFSDALIGAMQSLMEQADAAASLMSDPTLLQSLSAYLIPFYVIFAIIFFVLLVPLLYRFRMADHLLMDHKATGALRALGKSHQMMRYNRFSLFKLDLRLWWFYALQLISTVLCYGDLIWTVSGIRMPFSTDVAFFLFYGIHILSQLALGWWAKSYVATVYATAYNILLPEAEDPEPPVVKNSLWDLLPH